MKGLASTVVVVSSALDRCLHQNNAGDLEGVTNARQGPHHEPRGRASGREATERQLMDSIDDHGNEMTVAISSVGLCLRTS